MRYITYAFIGFVLGALLLLPLTLTSDSQLSPTLGNACLYFVTMNIGEVPRDRIDYDRSVAYENFENQWHVEIFLKDEDDVIFICEMEKINEGWKLLNLRQL
jgi:hypothetical protein